MRIKNDSPSNTAYKPIGKYLTHALEKLEGKWAQWGIARNYIKIYFASFSCKILSLPLSLISVLYL